MRFSKIISTIFLLSILIVLQYSCSNKREKGRFFPGLIGAYYGNSDLTSIKFAEELTSLNNNWTEQTGHGRAWSGQYVGYLVSPTNGNLTVIGETDKNIKLTIEGKKIKINAKNPIGKININNVEKGEKLPINLKFYYPEGKPGGFKISWEWKGHKKSVVPYGSFVYSVKQAKNWNWFIGPNPKTIDYSKFLQPKVKKDVIVFYEKGKFAGWPANGGLWHWGNEMLVNFTVGYYKEMQHHHSIDGTRPSQSILERSLDGGEHWTDEGEFKVRKVKKLPKIDFRNPNLAIKVYRNYFIVSSDRGKTWTGNYPIPSFGYKKLTNRTDYIPIGKYKCLFFFSHEDKSVQARLQDKSFAAITRDGSITFEKLGDQAPNDNYRSVMPSSILLSNNYILSATRRRYDEEFGDKAPRLPHDWIDVFESKDGGKTWNFLSKVAETDKGNFNGNPPSMIKLKDGRICITYGYRFQPYGIRAKLSSDEGKTWSKEIHIRDHARTFDFGYTRSAQRTDGKIVTIYYFTSNSLKQQHIETTIWDPNSIAFKTNNSEKEN